MAWFVLDSVEQMDLAAFHAAYRNDGWGLQAYEQAMTLAWLLNAYCEVERSSRWIERRQREHIAFHVLSGNQQPNHATICRLRQRHEQALVGLLEQLLRICDEEGLVRAGVGRWTGPRCAPTRAASATVGSSRAHTVRSGASRRCGAGVPAARIRNTLPSALRGR